MSSLVFTVVSSTVIDRAHPHDALNLASADFTAGITSFFR